MLSPTWLMLAYSFAVYMPILAGSFCPPYATVHDFGEFVNRTVSGASGGASHPVLVSFGQERHDQNKIADAYSNLEAIVAADLAGVFMNQHDLSSVESAPGEAEVVS